MTLLTRALWIQNYKQTKFIIWGLWFVTLLYPISLLSSSESLEIFLDERRYSNSSYMVGYVFNNGSSVLISFLQILIMITLATMLIGTQRSNQSMDFTLSLPFSRKNIFLSKWLYGVFHILAASSLSGFFSIIVFSSTRLNEFFPYSFLTFYFMKTIVVLIGVLSIGLLFGFICGSAASQFVLTCLFFILPSLTFTLFEESYRFHKYYFTGIRENNYYVQKFSEWVFDLNFPFQLIELDRYFSKIMKTGLLFEYFGSLVIPIIFTLISLGLIILLSKNVRSENNGKAFIFRPIEISFKLLIVFVAYMMGGLFFGASLYNYQTLYLFHIGGIIFSIIIYFLSSKMLGMKIFFGTNK
jgi:acetoin utilization transport system permease protein